MTDVRPVDPLENLTFTPVGGPAGGAAKAEQDAEADAAAAQEAQMLQAVSLGVSRIVFAGLRAVRSAIARRMPEILEEWPDEMLRGPADASAPVLQRYMARITDVMGRNPEVAMLFMSMVPMAMGFMAATEKHARTVEVAQAKGDA